MKYRLDKIYSNKNVIICVFLLLLLYIYYLHAYAYAYAQVHSDHVAPLLMAQDILNGNLLLEDWYGSTSSFFIGVYSFTLLPYILFGMTYEFFCYYPALIMSLIAACAFFLSYKYLGKRTISVSNIFILSALFLIPPKGIFSTAICQPFYHNETYLMILLILLIMDKAAVYGKGRLIFFGAATLLFSFWASADTFAIYVFVIPIAALILWRYFFYRIDTRYLYFLGCIAAGTTAARLTEKIVAKLGGIQYTGFAAPSFTSLNSVPARFLDSVGYTLDVFNANFFGEKLSSSLPLLLSFFVLSFSVYAVSHIIRNFKKYDIVTQFLVFSPIILFMIFLVADIPLANRYFIFIPIAFFILTARIGILDIIKEKHGFGNGVRTYIVLAFGCGLLLLNASANFMPISAKPENIENPVAKILIDKGLKRGYAEYWKANVMSFYTKNQSKVTAVEQISRPYYWLGKRSWYEEPANFIIASADETPSYIKYYGEPRHIYTVDNGLLGDHSYNRIDILEYDYNLSEGFSEKGLNLFACNNCEKTSRSVVLNKDGILYGPYGTFKKGIYRIEFKGKNLAGASFDAGIFSNGALFYEMKDKIVRDDEISYTIGLEEDAYNVEFRIINRSGESVVIESAGWRLLNE